MSPYPTHQFVAARTRARRAAVKRRWRLAPPSPVPLRALVIGDPDAAIDPVLSGALTAAGFEATTVRADHLTSAPSIAIALGHGTPEGDVGTDERDRPLAWLRHAADLGTPILGLGSGAQLLALAVGGGIEHAQHAQRGWSSFAHSADGLIPNRSWFSWHEDAIVLPPGAQLLASGRGGPEAFRADGHLGLQFDPFADASRVSKLIDASEQTVDVQGLLEATVREAGDARASARILLSRFVSAVARQAAGRA